MKFKDILQDRWLRLTHLYYTKTKYGVKTLFAPWPEQAELLSEMHYLNIILKARQRGITTAIQIFMLDACLFNRNISAGVIAHNQKDAQAFFRDKIKFAYDNLPVALREAIPATNDNAGELVFGNGSSIRVGTSMRSSTLQYLHISEYGKICAKSPDKALEIRTGSLNTVAPGCFVFIESTAEGAWGHFYDLCVAAEGAEKTKKTLTAMDYKFFFFPWFRAREYQLPVDAVEVDEDMAKYFMELKAEHDINLSIEQKNWYIKKHDEQGDDAMCREFPSTSDEAFRGIVEGAIFGKQMRKARSDGRITDIPVNISTPVYTFWDIGRNMTSIWFMQQVGPQCRFIDYYQEAGQELPYFADLILANREYRFCKYRYAYHYFPHDMDNTDWQGSEAVGKTRLETALSIGLDPARTCARIANRADGIEMARQALATSYFDHKRCDEYGGIKALENYRYEFNEKLGTYSDIPLGNWASHGADAWRQFAQEYRISSPSDKIGPDNPIARASYNRKRQRSKRV